MNATNTGLIIFLKMYAIFSSDKSDKNVQEIGIPQSHSNEKKTKMADKIIRWLSASRKIVRLRIFW